MIIYKNKKKRLIITIKRFFNVQLIKDGSVFKTKAFILHSWKYS